MASIYDDTNPHLLKTLLQQIHTREAALPDFQRDFVWEPAATQELIVSIASNYPAGSLLRIRIKKELFASRQFQGAPTLDGRKPTYLVLDGQQRLTSLYQAFYGVGDHRYFVRVGELLNGRDFEDCIFHERANSNRAKNLAKPEMQARELIVPLDVLQDGVAGFSQWSKVVRRAMPPGDQRDQLEDSLDGAGSVWAKAVDEYQFPVVTLSGDTSAEAICTIFETLNRTGVKLSVFELLTARFWPQNIRLRDLWAKAQVEFPILGAFEIDPYYVLQIIALVSATGAPSCKRSDVLDLTASDITVWWDHAVDGLARGLALLRDECGVMQAKWVPYYTILIPLGAVLAKQGRSVGPQATVTKEKIKQWFWCSVFGQAYESAPNAQTAKDTTEVLRWLEGSEPPETVSVFKFDPRVLRDSTPNQRAIYRGTIALILSQGPRDFHTSDRITTQLIEREAVDDHHIFPSGFLQKQPGHVPERLRNCVLNRTLIDKATNQRISDRAPATYMGDIQGTFARHDLSAATFRALLESHLIPAGPDSPLWSNDFETFLAERQNLLWQEIERVTGATTAAELVTEEQEVADMTPTSPLSEPHERSDIPAISALVHLGVSEGANHSEDALSAQFHQDMVNAYQVCIRDLHYRPAIVLQYLSEHSAVETAHWLVNLSQDSSGFTRLWEARRLDLSAEAMILKPEYASLFSVEDRRKAYDTLQAYHYAFPPDVQRP